MKDHDEAPSPDPAIGQAALKSAQLGEQWLSFAKDAYAVSESRQAELDALTKQVTQQQIGLANEAADNARADRQRYETTFRPVEDAFIEKATNYATPERQAEAAAEAGAAVESQGAVTRDAAGRRLAALGVAPDSGRFAGIDRSIDLQTTLGVADAKNRARQAVRDKGDALTADVINLGHGLPAQASAEVGEAANLGSGAVALTGQSNDAYLRNTSLMGTGYQGALSGTATQGNILSNLYNSQLSGWEANRRAQAEEQSGLFGAIGTGVGLLLRSDEKVKKNKKPIPEGEALDAVRAMPVEEWDYKPGVEDGGRHVGTYAQDFREQTGKGDGETIPVVDAIGVTMRAVQDLADRVDTLAATIGTGAAPLARRPETMGAGAPALAA